MPRKSTGKRSRFEVFKRDYYTCQYCGAQPPGVALVIDHIDPVANGGASTIDNLIIGGESGPGFRPMELDWARSLVNQCRAQTMPSAPPSPGVMDPALGDEGRGGAKT